MKLRKIMFQKKRYRKELKANSILRVVVVEMWLQTKLAMLAKVTMLL
jgi:hypothetical protein